jgi:hypothetical protein
MKALCKGAFEAIVQLPKSAQHVSKSFLGGVDGSMPLVDTITLQVIADEFGSVPLHWLAFFVEYCVDIVIRVILD